MDSDIEEIAVQSIWVFGNLAADSDKNIKKILNDNGIFDKILNILTFNNNVEIIKVSTWSISNFLKNNECPSFEKSLNIFKILSKNLTEINTIDKDFIRDSGSIISKVSFEHKILINEFTKNNNFIQKIISFLDIEDEKIIINSVNIINDISTGNGEPIQKLIDYNILDKLKKILLNETKPYIIKNVSWILSNIACENKKMVEILVNNDLIPILVNTFNSNVDIEVKKASLFAICNIFNRIKNKAEYIEKVMKEGFIKILLESLKIEDPECITISIETINKILDLDKKINSNFKILLKKLEIINILKNLKLYPNENVQHYAEKLSQKFVDIEKEK